MSRKLATAAIQFLCLLWACDSGRWDPHAPSQVPTKLAFTRQPGAAIAGAAISPVTITVQDAYGNTVASAGTDITVAIGNNPGRAALSGTTTMAAVGGLATFSNLSLDNAGTGYTLTADAPGLIGVTSGAFNVIPAQAGSGPKLAFFVQPSKTTAGDPITPAVQVMVQDDPGNLITSASTTVTVAIGTNPNGGRLSGTTSVAAVNGIATFSDLSIDNPGAGYILTVSANGLNDNTSAPFTISSFFTGLAAVTAGGYHSCAVTTAGAAYCWGNNDYGELGNGWTVQSSTPVAVAGGLTFAEVSAGSSHSCGLTIAGEAYCWGDNRFGQLGNGSTAQSSTPVAVAGGLTFAEVSAGNLHSCGVTTTGAAYCWGENSSGELGNGSLTNSSTPQAVVGGLTFAAVSAGSYFTCGLTTSGAGYCWGDNGLGELGNGSTPQTSTPVAVTGGLTFAAVSSGSNYACGLTTAGAAYCWGFNAYGELGNSSSAGGYSNMPVAVTGSRTFAAVNSTGAFHSCGLTMAGAAFCWGRNDIGELGTGRATGPEVCGASEGETAGCSNTPLSVSGGLTFVTITVGGSHSCGLTTAGEAWCWGSNGYGQLGTGSTLSSPTPVRVSSP